MSWQVVVMFVIAALLSVAGIGMLLALTRPQSPGRVYAFRMIGIMMLAAGIVLGLSANAMWQWGTER
jgi:hypothetical protein